MSDEDRLDVLCMATRKPAVLNTLHACRNGHPLGTEWRWRNAAALVAQNAIDFVGIDTSWLVRKAREEGADRAKPDDDKAD